MAVTSGTPFRFSKSRTQMPNIPRHLCTILTENLRLGMICLVWFRESRRQLPTESFPPPLDMILPGMVESVGASSQHPFSPTLILPGMVWRLSAPAPNRALPTTPGYDSAWYGLESIGTSSQQSPCHQPWI
jgi:hypothetical protein